MLAGAKMGLQDICEDGTIHTPLWRKSSTTARSPPIPAACLLVTPLPAADDRTFSVLAAAQDPIKKTFLQLQKTFTVDGVTTPLGPQDVEASRLYPDYFYTPIAKYMNNLIDTFRTQLAAEE